MVGRATDMLVATNSHSQKNRVAPRALASRVAVDALIDPLPTRTPLAAFMSGWQRRAAAAAPCSARSSQRIRVPGVVGAQISRYSCSAWRKFMRRSPGEQV